MLDCSAQQGNGDAAYRLANYLWNVEENANGTLKYYQLSARNGHRAAASTFEEAFKPNIKENSIYYLPVKSDIERSARYEAIVVEIRNNPDARFPDIDKIVPLPPAELPEWDSTFEYKKQAEGQ